MVELAIGSEPYSINHYVKKMRNEMEMPDMNFQKGDSLEKGLSFLECAPFVDEKRIFVLETEKFSPTEKEKKLLLEMNESNNLLVLVPTVVDKRKKFFTELKERKCIKEFNKLSRAQLGEFIKKGVAEYGSSISPQDLDYFIDRTDYCRDNSVNLYTIRNFVIQLCFSGEKIERSKIDYFVPEHRDANSFKLFEFIVKKDGKNAVQHLFKLIDDGEGAILVLSAALRNFRICFKRKLLDAKDVTKKLEMSSKQLYFTKFAKNMSLEDIYNCMDSIQTAVNQIKSGQDEKAVSASLIAKMLGGNENE